MSQNKHYDTPHRARVQGAHAFLLAKGIAHDERDIFEFFNLKERTGYRMIQPGASSCTHHHSVEVETRGRKRKFTSDEVREADAILQDDTLGLEGKALTWDQLETEVGADVFGRTMQKIMRDALDYGKHLACMNGWLSESAKKRRVEWATFMKARYPEPEDGYRVRFSDEVHFGYGPKGQLQIIRKPGTRYRFDCLQHSAPPPSDKKDRKRKHCWAAVGYNFKSNIIFYEVPGNKNGKMTHKVYIDSILETVVKLWIVEGHDFALEEDGDSGHGTSKKNPVREWKEEHGLESYFICPQSPDLAVIENCWAIPKIYTRKYPHWDDATLETLIKEGWAQVSQDFINRKVQEMPDRL